MSLTDQEMEIIRQTAAQLHETVGTPYGDVAGGAASFFQDRRDLRLFEHEIFEYSFENPIQLKAELEKMWEYQDAGYMKAFSSVCVVSAFKHKSSPDTVPEETQISPFVYEY